MGSLDQFVVLRAEMNDACIHIKHQAHKSAQYKQNGWTLVDNMYGGRRRVRRLGTRIPPVYLKPPYNHHTTRRINHGVHVVSMEAFRSTTTFHAARIILACLLL